MTPRFGDDADAQPGSATEGVIRLSEVVKGIVHQLETIDRKMDQAVAAERKLLERIASIESKLAVSETNAKHEANARRKTERLLHKVLWAVACETLTVIGAIVVWLVTKG